MPAVSAKNAFRFFGERYRLPDPKGAEGGDVPRFVARGRLVLI